MKRIRKEQLVGMLAAFALLFMVSFSATAATVESTMDIPVEETVIIEDTFTGDAAPDVQDPQKDKKTKKSKKGGECETAKSECGGEKAKEECCGEKGKEKKAEKKEGGN